MAKRTGIKFKNTGEMLAFLKTLDKRNEAAIKNLDKALKYEVSLVEAIEVRESSVAYKKSKK